MAKNTADQQPQNAVKGSRVAKLATTIAPYRTMASRALSWTFRRIFQMAGCRFSTSFGVSSLLGRLPPAKQASRNVGTLQTVCTFIYGAVPEVLINAA
jgi:hypothetical protein